MRYGVLCSVFLIAPLQGAFFKNFKKMCAQQFHITKKPCIDPTVAWSEVQKLLTDNRLTLPLVIAQLIGEYWRTASITLQHSYPGAMCVNTFYSISNPWEVAAHVLASCTRVDRLCEVTSTAESYPTTTSARTEECNCRKCHGEILHYNIFRFSSGIVHCTGPSECMATDEYGHLLVTTSGSFLRVLDLQEAYGRGCRRNAIDAGVKDVTNITFCPRTREADTARIAVSHGEGDIDIYSIEQLAFRYITRRKAHQYPVHKLIMMRNKKWLLSQASEAVHVWDITKADLPCIGSICRTTEKDIIDVAPLNSENILIACNRVGLLVYGVMTESSSENRFVNIGSDQLGNIMTSPEIAENIHRIATLPGDTIFACDQDGGLHRLQLHV